jgi:predicted amidohydrolase
METTKHLFAFFQGAPEVGKVQANLSKMKEQLCKAAAVGAELLIFPELFLSGYCVPGEEMKRLAEERDGPSFRELSQTARESKIAVLYGYPEVDDSSGAPVYYNSAQLIDRDGSSLVNYHKTHLWIDHDGYEKVFHSGDSFSKVVECCNVRIGILLCFDMEFPECTRTLALDGAKLIVIPTAISNRLPPELPEKISSFVIPARARENRVHVVAVNHGRGDFAGQSVCCDRNGEVVVKAGQGEQLLFFSINPSSPVENEYLSQRRPQIYDF